MAVHLVELRTALTLAIEQLQDGHAGDVFLQVGVDARDGEANPPVALGDAAPEHDRHQNDEGHDRKHDAGQ